MIDCSDIYLHHDIDLMPRNKAAWSAWNFLGSTEKKVCVTYWLNILQVYKTIYMLLNTGFATNQ